MRGLLRVVVNAVGVWVATLLVSGVELTSALPRDRLLTVLLAGAGLTVVNAVVKPVVQILAISLYVLTLGLVHFAINAAMLMLVAAAAGWLGVGFRIDGFWPEAVLAGLVVTVVTLLLDLVLRD